MCSVALHLIFGDQVLSLNMDVTVLARLAGHQDPGIHLSPLSSTGVPGAHSMEGFSMGV